jgi:ribosomal protein L37E
LEKISTPGHQTPNLAKKHSKTSIWCPYCGEWRSFSPGPYGRKVCPDCGISEADFWVKTANNNWGFGIKPRGVKRDGE